MTLGPEPVVTTPLGASVPLYEQIARQLLADLDDAPRPGERLPSERAMCERYGVSRVTMRAALAHLADRGWVSPSAARGWFVTAGPTVDSSFTEMAAVQGIRGEARVIHAQLRSANLDEAETFSIVPGADLFDLRRVRLLADLVIAVDHSRIPAQICPGIEQHDFAVESLYQVLRSSPSPVIPTVADYSVEAVAATAEEAELLELSPAAPVLAASQRTFDQHRRVFELGRTAYRGDRYRFRATLGVRTR